MATTWGGNDTCTMSGNRIRRRWEMVSIVSLLKTVFVLVPQLKMTVKLAY
jgi:hypothetical protein